MNYNLLVTLVDYLSIYKSLSYSNREIFSIIAKCRLFCIDYKEYIDNHEVFKRKKSAHMLTITFINIGFINVIREEFYIYEVFIKELSQEKQDYKDLLLYIYDDIMNVSSYKSYHKNYKKIHYKTDKLNPMKHLKLCPYLKLLKTTNIELYI